MRDAAGPRRRSEGSPHLDSHGPSRGVPTPDVEAAPEASRPVLRTDLRDSQLEESSLILFLDFETKFPSPSREYVVDVLDAAGASASLLRAVRALYTLEASTIDRAAPIAENSFRVASWAPQGCCILCGESSAASCSGGRRRRGERLCLCRGRRPCRAVCAHPAASPAHLEAFGAATALRVRRTKSAVVPLRRVRRDMRDILAQYKAEPYVDFGVVVGPGASLDSRWKEAVRKVNDRVTSVARAGVAPFLGLRHVSSHVVLVLSYVAQVAPQIRKKCALHLVEIMELVVQEVRHEKTAKIDVVAPFVLGFVCVIPISIPQKPLGP